MASSAAHISVQTGAPVHAPHGKAHNKVADASTGDSFADMLATADAVQQENKSTPTRERAPVEKSKGDKSTAGEKSAASDEQTSQADTAGETAETAAATDTDTDTVADAGQAVAPVTEDKTDAANDNAPGDVAALLPQPEQPAPTPQAAIAATPAVPVQAQIADTAQDKADGEATNPGIAPLAAANSGNAAAKPAPQAENTPATGDGEAAAPDAAEGTAEPAATGKKTAKTAEGPDSDFKKALHEARATPDKAEALAQTRLTDADKPAEALQTTPAAATKPATDVNTITLAPQAAPAAASPGAEKLTLTAHVETPASPQATPNVNQFAVDVAARSQSGAKQFDIRLDPPELGRVEVRLSIDAHGKAEAHLTADQPQTLDLLQKDAPALARALREAGLNVQQDGLNFSLKQQQQHAGGDDASRHGARGGFNGHRNNSETGQQDEGATIRRSLGLLDIRV